jgi:uncharacterized NAD(P)/FAD-binding protein YdhS
VLVQLFDRGDERHMGPAYSDEAPYLLLNVPAGRMGAVAEDPEQFLRWTQRQGVRAGASDFLPRRLYRDYVRELMHEVQHQRSDGPRSEHVRGEVTDIEPGGAGVRIHVDTGRPVVVDRAVLALGNFPPRDPSIENRTALASARYIRNPWSSAVLDSLSRHDTVCLIGTGQTTVDLVVALHRRAHQGRIIALSRRGMLPLAHRGFESYDSFAGQFAKPATIRAMFRTVRTHLARADALGVDRRAVIDSLRPDTQTLWLNLADDEKRRFLRHAFRYWEIIRSRIPPESEAIIDGMRAAGQLGIIAARIRDLVETDAAIDVHYTVRGGTTHRVERAALVINCIGPESDYGRVEHVLVRNLLDRGLIRSGPARLGIDARPDGAIIGRDGKASNVLYTLGSTMKGVLWEVLAVPEIRVQAERLALTLLGGVTATAVRPRTKKIEVDPISDRAP